MASPLRIGAAAALATQLVVGPGFAQLAEVVPKGFEGVGLTQVLDAEVPKDVPFTDDHGAAVSSGFYFDGTRPVLLTFNYTDCPLMCSQQLDGFVDALRQLEGVTPGEDFQIVTVSIDHRETWKKASLTKEKYLRDLGPDRAAAAADGWHFLVGAEGNIRRLADAVGFHYKWIDPTTKYSHVPAIIILTPEGHTSQYFSGWDYGPDDLRRALRDASGGKIGQYSDSFFYSCFRYDPDQGVTGMVIMRVGAALAVVALASFVILMRRMEPKMASDEAAATSASAGEQNADDTKTHDQKTHDAPGKAKVAP